MYETDGDNYLDLCLLLNENRNPIESIKEVIISAGRVRLPRGNTGNE